MAEPVEREASWTRTEQVRWEAFDSGGWEYLLPHDPGARWLCIDCTGGATSGLLGQVFEELTVVPGRPEERALLAERVEQLGIPGVRLAPGGELPRAAADGRPFDGFVLHDLQGRLDRSTLLPLLAAAPDCVSAEGCVYVALQNAFSYSRARRAWHGEPSPGRTAGFRPGGVAGAVAGRSRRLYPFISEDDGRLLDVVMPTGYVSSQNPRTRGERLRRALLGPIGAPLIAPAFALVGRGAGGPRTILESAVDRIERQRAAPLGSFVVSRYRCLPGGKAVVWAGSPEAGAERFILLFARSPVAIARRRHEFELLEQLARLPPDLAARVPRPEHQEDLAGGRYFVMREFPGVTLEANVPELDTATAEAAAFIGRLHEASRTPGPPGRVEAAIAPMFDAALARYPALAALLAALRKAVRRALANVEIPLVWMHGDFKVENVVVDPLTSRLSGVIDWEHAESEGLPLLDLWYLFLYNRKIRAGQDFFPAVRDLLPPARPASGESQQVEDYLVKVGVPARALPSLVGLLILHHCARRVFYDNRDAGRMKQIAGTLEDTIRWINAAEANRA